MPTAECRYSDWISFALKWAELSALIQCGSEETDKNRLRETVAVLNANFAEWLSGHYASLIKLPPSNPPMLHHVTRRLARGIECTKESRIPLLVIDRLALNQWVTIRQILQEQDLAIFLLEAALHTTPEGKAALGLLLNNPAFFPFKLPVMTGDFVAQRTDRIDLVRCGLDDELLKLKGK